MKHILTAIITDKKGRVLSIGKNSYVKTHPLQAQHANKVGLPEKPFMHAEIHAITRLKNLSKAHKISIFRYNKHGQPVNAAPCPICLSALKQANIKVIEHT